MRKRLLLSLMATCMAVSGFALSQGEYVYTPQGRFQITGDNLNANSAFADYAGWTVVSASADKTIAEIFNQNANGYAEGINSVQSLDATAGEGMYYQFVPTDASSAYVVSFKMKGSFAETTRIKTASLSTNLVRVAGNTDGVYGGETDVVYANTAEELTEDWQTFNYAIVGDGTARTYFISFTGMATDIQIADVQIAPAIQFADLRQRDAMLEKLAVYATCYNWGDDLLAEYAVIETIENLRAIGDESGQAELDEQLETAQEVLDEFLKANMDDYLGSNDAHLGIKTTSGNLQKQTTLGGWTCVDRGFWSSNAYPDLGHYQQTNSWANGNPTNAMGVTIQKELSAGSYVFAIEGNAAFRENKKQSWDNDDGMKPAYAVVYVVKIVDGAATDTIVAVKKDLEPVNFTQFLVTANVAEAGTYEFGYKAYCKEAYQSLKLGSVTYVRNAYIWGKNGEKYNQKELAYEANVRTQITTGRDNLTKAAEYIANADYFWGKAELQACVDSVAPRIAAYEAMDQDAIIATYDKDLYESSTSNESGLLQYEVYQTATKYIIAANKKFVAVNDTLNSTQGIIDAAEATLVLRVYDAATGKADLQAAIDNAKAMQAQMKAGQYSEENAAAIVAGNAALTEAIATFKTTVPAEAITTIVDIDFENAAVLNEETQLYSITGAAGSMEFSNFSPDGVTPSDDAYQQGIWSNGEQLYKGYVRVGSGTGTVNFDPTIDGSMGTNILKVNFDFFLQGLSGKSVGFFMKNGLEGDDAKTVAAFYPNYYDNTIGENTFNIDLGSLKYGSGSSYNDASPEGAEDATATVQAKNSFELIFDFGEGSMYATTTSGKGTVTTQKVAFDGTVPRNFILQCNYSGFASRRCWFDNLKIERIKAGATDPFVDGIAAVKADVKAAGIYNLAGQKVDKSYKGIVIVNGKKMIQK
ncbi:MAG: hypothetical protein IJ637_05130 [Prevotella sp.]|nr:hypothetical protein [Prevotella sp.]